MKNYMGRGVLKFFGYGVQLFSQFLFVCKVNAHVRRGFGRTSLDKGMIQTFVGVVTREGFFGLFKGLVPSMFKAAANSGFSFLFYKMACDVLRAL